jgi:hypothetical protein
LPSTSATTIGLFDPHARPRVPDRGPGVTKLRRTGWFAPRTRLALQIGAQRQHPILDTGATHTYVDGQRLGLEPGLTNPQVTVRGTGGSGSAVRTVATFQVAAVQVGDQPTADVTLIDRDRNWWEPGLLGLDLLSRFRQEYDFGRARAVLAPVTSRPLPSFRAAWPPPPDGPPPPRLLDALAPSSSVP